MKQQVPTFRFLLQKKENPCTGVFVSFLHVQLQHAGIRVLFSAKGVQPEGTRWGFSCFLFWRADGLESFNDPKASHCLNYCAHCYPTATLHNVPLISANWWFLQEKMIDYRSGESKNSSSKQKKLHDQTVPCCLFGDIHHWNMIRIREKVKEMPWHRFSFSCVVFETWLNLSFWNRESQQQFV